MRSALVNILGSNALSQLLIIASTPLLTRSYPQADFGAFGVATTLALVISTLLTLRLEHSIHVTRRAPAKLYSTCLALAWTSTVLIGVPLLCVLIWLEPAWLAGGASSAGRLAEAGHLAGHGTASVERAAEATFVIADLSLILLFAVAHASLVVSQIFLNYQQRFRWIAALSLLVPLVFVAGALTLPQLPGQPNGLLFWQAVAYSVGAVVVVYRQRRYISLPSRREIRSALVRERANWQFLVPSQLLSIVSLNLSVIGAAWLFDPAVAGLVVIAQRIARAPVTVVGNGLNEVLRAAIPARRAIRRTFIVISGICTLAGATMIVAVYLIPDSLWGRLLGSGWSGLRAILLITVVGSTFQLIGTSVISMLTSFEKRSDLMVNAGLFVAGALALGVSMLVEADTTTYLWLHTILSSMIYLAGFWLAWRIAKQRSGDLPGNAAWPG